MLTFWTDYPAVVAGNLVRGGADPIGIRDMANDINAAASQCPDSVLAVAGYR